MWYVLFYLGSVFVALITFWFVVKEDLVREQGIPLLIVFSFVPLMNIVVAVGCGMTVYDSSPYIESLGYKIAKFIRGE